MRYDLIVLGAGPAGLAAAREAAEAGLSVALLDEQPRAGGQIYRDVERAAARRGAILGADYTHGIDLVRGIDTAGIRHMAGTVVWAIEEAAEGISVSCTRDGRATQIHGARLLIATGALERPMPMPGWTLPGVMTAGAGQILLKASGMVARRAVLVGSGPLLYLIAAQMVRAGVPPLALVETQTREDFTGALRHLPGALRGWRYLLKGARMLAEIRRAGVVRYRGAREIAIEGAEAAEAVRFTAGGQAHRIECDTVLLHHGVVPNTQAARSIGIAHRWDRAQRAFLPQCDAWGATEQPGLWMAGDGTGIGGAKQAEIAGRLAALDIACAAGTITTGDRDLRAVPLRRASRGELAARPFLDAAYPPYEGALRPEDAVTICRCEEISAGDIRAYARLGCLGPNQAKAFGRPGMGPCQGRYCGLTVTALLAEAHGRSEDETGYYRIRAPIKPVTLGELAQMQEGEGFAPIQGETH